MTDDALQRQFKAARDRTPATRDGCIAVDDLAAAAQHRDSEAARLTVLEHVATCASCRDEFDLLRSIAETRPRSSMRRAGWSIGAAAMAAALTLLLWRGNPPGGSSFRGAETTVLVHDAITDSGSVHLAWRPVEGASRYVVEVIAPDGTAAASVERSDTVATIPLDGLGAAEYRWSVQASLRDGRTVESPFHTFRVAR